jgi:DNA-binding NarL/FixJ family response regulator
MEPKRDADLRCMRPNGCCQYQKPLHDPFTKRDLAIINCILEGKPLSLLARRRHLNLSTMMYHKERLGKAIQAFMGTDILIEVGRKPRWKESINATREKLACHDQRRSL